GIGSLDLNTSTVMYNPELFHALEVTRRGGDDPLFDQMFAGLRLSGVETLGSRTLDSFGVFFLDGNIQKSFRLTETKQLSRRVDALFVTIPGLSMRALLRPT